MRHHPQPAPNFAHGDAMNKANEILSQFPSNHRKNTAGNLAKVLPFRRPRRRRPRAIPMNIRGSHFTLTGYCPSNPEYRHDWVETDIPGWSWCRHCRGWQVDATGKVVNRFPASTAWNYCPGSQNHRHCWQDCSEDGHPELSRCAWCNITWKRQFGGKASGGQ